MLTTIRLQAHPSGLGGVGGIKQIGLDPLNPNTVGYFAAGLLLADSMGFPDSTVEACNYMIIEACSGASLSNCEVAYIVSAKITPCLQEILTLMGEDNIVLAGSVTENS